MSARQEYISVDRLVRRIKITKYCDCLFQVLWGDYLTGLKEITLKYIYIYIVLHKLWR